MAVTVVALTGAPEEPQAIGQFKAKFVELTGDASTYAAGGYLVTPAQFGLSKILMMQLGSASGFVAEFLPAPVKIRVRQSAGSAAALAEVADGTNLSAVTWRGIVWGY